MTDDIGRASLIRTKLHRPPIPEEHVPRQRLFDLLGQPNRCPLTLVVAPAGYGKSMLVSNWLEAGNSQSAWVSLDENDNDIRQLLNYIVAAVQTIFPGTLQEIQALVNALTLPPVPVLAGILINEIDRIDKPFNLVLDDFHLIQDESVLALLTQLLRHPPQAMHLVLVSRRDPSLPISKLRANNLLREVRTQNLRFNEVEIASFFAKLFGVQVDSSTAASLERKTEGWVTGLRLAALSMLHRGNIHPELLGQEAHAQYVMEYLFTETLSHQPPAIKQCLLGSAILDRFCGPLCEALCVSDPVTATCEFSGWEFIAWLKKENLFLIPLDAENRWFRFHHLFQTLLLSQLKRHCSAEDINDLHARASAWYAESDLIEEAIQHALKGGSPEAAASLVAQHGFELVSKEQWSMLKRWLELFTDDIIYQDPELTILVAWTHLTYYRVTDVASCLSKAEALLPTRTIAKHIQGHMDALRGYVHYMAADGERALACLNRANKNIPRAQGYARMRVLYCRFMAYQMIGNSEKALAAIEQMIEDETLRGASTGHLLASPCFVYWMMADLNTMLQTIDRAKKVDLQLENPFVLGHSRHFAGIAYYQRNELDIAKKELLPVFESPYYHHALNFAHSAFALALVYQAWGQADEARKVVESVVSYAFDTDNTPVLRLARAFQAEMALRQGRITEASHWAEHFVAKPLTPMYRFYVPQLTLVRVLLTINTAKSCEQAKDLLAQLYEFVVSTHNIRFQIDVLALQALLHHLQDDEPAALKALTESLTLAELGGIIRTFLDLGPQMANLLKRLVKKNIAVEYIGRILAAFKEDEIRAAPDEKPIRQIYDGQESNPPNTRRTRIENSMLDPLTNRELDVLELLAQRLSNKEIAEKLFISDGTVKKHLNNIYQKLDVRKRREAVEKARLLGILD